MLPTLGDGDPSEASRTALVWYRVVPGEEGAFEEALGNTVVPWERARGTPSATGRFLLADGWHYLRIIGLESLGAYQAYWTDLRGRSGYDAELARTVLARRDVLLARVPGLSVR